MEAVDRVVVERGSVGLAATACVRVRDAAGEVVGSGFLLGPDLVATCAHVIAAAIGADMYGSAVPAGAVSLDFPMLPGAPVYRSARVHRWVPIGADGSGDVALLRLSAAAPAGAVMPPVRRVEGLWDHRFRAFGFPEGRWDGVWATGHIRGGQGTGWFQLQGSPGEAAIEGGFSGSPVWDDESAAVVGMTVAADRDPGVTTAYLIPIEQVLGLDPELLPCPYRGLEPFDEEHAEVFFGREPELRRLRAALEASALVVVDGPSGAGKSSLVRAGLLPALRADGAAVAVVEPRPGLAVVDDAVAGLLGLADPGSSAVRNARDAARLAAALADPSARAAALDELAQGVAGATSRLVLFVDQFEELSEAAPDTAAELLGLLAELATRAGTDGPLRIVLTARGLALHEALTPAVADALGSGSVLVGAMDRARLREAVVRPAERAPGLAFDDGLVDRILDDAGAEPGQLPLLESLLAQLWDRREGGALTNRAYREAGGVAGALAAHAEHVITTVPGDEDRLRALLTRLAVPGRDGRFVRKPVRYADLPPELRELVAPLAAGRLVVVAGSPSSGGTVELAHQALIEHWPRLAGWLAADRDFLAWHAQLDNDRRRWATTGDDAALLRGTALATAEDWATRRAGELTGPELDYLQHSLRRHQRERRRTRIIVATLTALVLVAGALTIVSVRTTGRNATQQATANAKTLAREATIRAQSDPLLAAQLALAAAHNDPDDATARAALANQYLALDSTDSVVTGAPGAPPLIGIAAGGTGPDATVGYSTSGSAATLRPGLLGPHPQQRELTEPSGLRGQLSPDGLHYAYVTGDGAVRLLDLTQGAAADPRQLGEPGRQPDLIGFAPDSSRFGSLTRDGNGRPVLAVHDVRTGSTTTTKIDIGYYPAGLTLTADPDLILVRQGAAGKPGSRLSVRSLARNAEVRTLPADAVTTNDGADTLTCTPSGPDPGDRTVLTVADAATGAEVRRLALLSAVSCQTYWLSADGRYVLQPAIVTPRAAQNIWRATERATGRSYQFATPPLGYQSWPPGTTYKIALVPDASGGVTALVAAGPTLLRVRATLEVPADTGGRPVLRYPVADGHTLLALDQGGQLNAYRTDTGARVGGLPDALPTEARWAVDDRNLWVLRRGGTGWVLDGYALPALTPVARVAVPSPPTPAPGGALLTSGDNATGRITVTLVGGVLSAFDGNTGRPLGPPVKLAHTPEETAAYRDRASFWSREGHPGQVLVATPAGRLQLWDVPAGRLVRELPVAVQPGDANAQAIAAAGDVLAHRSGADRIDLWNLATGERTAQDLPLPETGALAGFDDHGDLVAATEVAAGDELVTLYDVNRRSEVASFRPAAFGLMGSDGPRFWITGWLMPLAVVTDPARWRGKLCELVAGQPSDAMRAALPPDADDSPPCGAAPGGR